MVAMAVAQHQYLPTLPTPKCIPSPDAPDMTHGPPGVHRVTTADLRHASTLPHRSGLPEAPG